MKCHLEHQKCILLYTIGIYSILWCCFYLVIFNFVLFLQYFESRFKINNTCQHNLLCEQFESFFSVAAMLPVLITNVANVYIQSR